MQNNCMDALDDTDKKLLSALQRNPQQTRKELAAACHVSESTCSRRLAALRRKGYILGEAVLLNRRKLGQSVCVFVLVAVEHEHTEIINRFIQRLRKLPEVTGISLISGEYDYLIQVAASDMEAYSAFAEEFFVSDPFVRKYQSLFEMKSLKS